MFGLDARFATRMPKRASNAQEGTTPVLEVSSDKHLRLSRSEEQVQANSIVITVDFSERVFEAPSAIGVAVGGAI